MRWAIVTFACVAMLAALPTAARAQTLNGQLAAVVEGRLVTVNPDGSGLRTLWTPQGASEITGLAWSPDGNRLAFSYTGRIVVFDVAARRGVTITDGDRDTSPGWSTDGRRIGFVRGGATMTVPAEGGEATRLPFSIPVGATALAWAPNLADIVVVVPPLLLLADVPLISTGVIGTPAWSPDGQRIAFADSSGLRAVTTGLVPVSTTITGQPAGSPRWSPDGGSIAYPADGSLRTVALAGGTPRVVLSSGVTSADWQPCTAGVTTGCESVSPPNCTPAALNATTQADQPVDLPAATCTDPAGRPLTLMIVRPPDHGTLVGLRYTPAAGFTGQDSVVYRVSNGFGESGLVRISIFVVPRPAAAPIVVSPAVQRAPFLSARAKPRIDRRRRVRVRLACDQNCTVALRLTARLQSKRTLRGTVVRRSLVTGRVVALRLRLPSKPRTRLKTVWITGTVTNAAGLRRSVKLPVTLPQR
jgi:Bacterial Ig domain/WD40-like Beta Propeller Repeat